MVKLKGDKKIGGKINKIIDKLSASIQCHQNIQVPVAKVGLPIRHVVNWRQTSGSMCFGPLVQLIVDGNAEEDATMFAIENSQEPII